MDTETPLVLVAGQSTDHFTIPQLAWTLLSYGHCPFGIEGLVRDFKTLVPLERRLLVHSYWVDTFGDDEHDQVFFKKHMLLSE
jgi:hypothetical protein